MNSSCSYNEKRMSTFYEAINAVMLKKRKTQGKT